MSCAPFHFVLMASGIGYEAGAIPKRARLEIDALLQAGHRVTAVGMGNSNPRVALPCDYREVKPWRVPRPLASVILWASFERKVAKLLKTLHRRMPIDGIVMHEQLFGLRQRGAARALPAKWIHVVHRTLWDTVASGANPFNPVFTRLLDCGARRELGSADGVVALHEAMATEILAHCPSAPPPQIVPNGIELGRIRMSPFDQRPAKKITFLGRISPEKRLDDLLEAIADLNDSAIELDVIGGSPDNGDAAQESAHRLGLVSQVTFHGNVSPERVHTLLDQSTLLVLPSVSEGMPFAILEALAHGLPVIASDIPGNRYLLEGGVGRLFPPGDIICLRTELKSLLDDAPTRRALSEKALARAQTLAWPQILQKVTQYYVDVVRT